MECLQYERYTYKDDRKSYWVLNLVISGMPSIHPIKSQQYLTNSVLNLVISGMPSIPLILTEYWFYG